MRILKHGRYYDKYRVFKCPHCECIFELEDKDLKDYDFDFVTADTLWECPECGSRIANAIGGNLKDALGALNTMFWVSE